jgi:CSLREA domain-containing protein
MRYPSALLAAAATVLLLASPAAAATVHVDVQNDEDDGSCAPGDCSLREAVKYSPAGSTIDVPAGDYPLGNQLTVPRSMTIDGAGQATTTVDAQHSTFRAFRVTGGPVTFRELKITGGAATGDGGAIEDVSGTLLTLDRVRLTDNNASAATGTGGGGGAVSAHGPVSVTKSLIDTNSMDRFDGGAIGAAGGGAIYVIGGAVTVTDSELSGNRAFVDGATSNPAAPVTKNGGGAIYLKGGSLTLTRSTLADNSASVGSGNALNENGGGGVYSNGARVTVVNSTITSNEASVPAMFLDNGGGGLFIADAPGSLQSATIAGNSTQSGSGPPMDAGGALYREGGPVTARDTILAGNTADTSDKNCFGAITSQGHNIEDANTCGLTGPGDKKSTPITLGPLAANGGPTRTRAVFTSSPAFDAGFGCPSTDQRGVARPTGTGCDIGAFEIAVPAVVTRSATGVQITRARLRGTVTPNGKPTTWSFHYGKTTAYGKSTPARSAGSDSIAHPFSATVKGLKPATRYHFRLFAANSLGASKGGDRRFITQMRLPAKCVRNRKLTVRLGRPVGSRVVNARAFAGKKRVARRTGHDVKRLKLRGLPGKPFRLRVVAKLASGESVTGSRRYKACG